MRSIDKIRALREAFLQDAAEQWDHYLARCESPIEQLFLASAMVAGWQPVRQEGFAKARDLVEVFAAAFGADGTGGVLILQPRIGRFRCDFALVERLPWGGKFVRIAIELDGHDFHEKTKTQAAMDKARDRILTRGGWRVLRFTGSEVWRDAADCFAEANALLEKELYL